MTQTKSEIIREACLKYPKLPTLTVARTIYLAHPFLWDNLELVRNAVRYRRGNNGKRNRRKGIAESFRPNQPAGFVWTFPESIAPAYIPFVLGDCKALVLSDLHIPFHDTEAITAAITEGKKRNPDLILLNGDVCDFFSLSKFEKNPQTSILRDEVNLTRQFLGWLRQEFPKARIIYKLGNHDEWFDRFLFRKAPELYGVAGVSLKHLTTAKIETLPEVGGIEWVDDQRKILAGKLEIWHGHEMAKGSIAPPVNPARGLFMKTLECGIMGHLHKESSHSETTSNGKLITCWSTGCLCGLWPQYARVNKWGHSAAFITVERGMFRVEPIRILKGKVL